MQKIYDSVVIGAGPSGAMAAGRLALFGASVLVLEKESFFGKKLSITGGGRCNITNAEFDNRKLLKNYGKAEKFLYSPFSKFSVKDCFDFFESRGLPLVVEARGRVFPKSQNAQDVVRLMRDFVEKSGAELLFNAKVRNVEFDSESGLFKLSYGKDKSVKAKTVLFAVGGPSGGKFSGQLPSSWKILQKLGHSVAAPSPDLVPLKTRAGFVRRLSGLSMSFVALRFKVDNKTQFKKLGKVLFTHFGVSGPTVINSSKEAMNLLKKFGRLTLSIDFFPDTDFDKLDRRLLALIEKHKAKKIRNVLSELVPEELAKTVIFLVNKNLPEVKAGNLLKEERKAIVRKLKDFSFNISGSMGLEKAIVADGGVDIKEIDFSNMESKIVSGLFLSGDVINIRRPSGGYSLQLCWTTGSVAAQGMAEKLGLSASRA